MRRSLVNLLGLLNDVTKAVKKDTLQDTVLEHICYQFRVPRNLRIDIKDRLEEYSQSIEIDIHDCTQTQKSQVYHLL